MPLCTTFDRYFNKTTTSPWVGARMRKPDPAALSREALSTARADRWVGQPFHGTPAPTKTAQTSIQGRNGRASLACKGSTGILTDRLFLKTKPGPAGWIFCLGRGGAFCISSFLCTALSPTTFGGYSQNSAQFRQSILLNGKSILHSHKVSPSRKPTMRCSKAPLQQLGEFFRLW